MFFFLNAVVQKVESYFDVFLRYIFLKKNYYVELIWPG